MLYVVRKFGIIKINKLEFVEVTMNKITCICLGVKDMEKSITFYRDGLGYKTDCKEIIRRYVF